MCKDPEREYEYMGGEATPHGYQVGGKGPWRNKALFENAAASKTSLTIGYPFILRLVFNSIGHPVSSFHFINK